MASMADPIREPSVGEVVDLARERVRLHGGECTCNDCRIARGYLDLAHRMEKTGKLETSVFFPNKINR